jgi:hypothetical protein
MEQRNDGVLGYWCSIWLKNNTVHGINKPWIEKTSTEDLKNSEFGLRPGGQDAVCLYVLACKITKVMRF